MKLFPRIVLLAALPAFFAGCGKDDPSIEQDTAELEVEAGENAVPVLTLYEPISGTRYSWNEEIQISGRVSDDDTLTKLAVDFYSDIDGFVGEGVMDTYGTMAGEIVGLTPGTHALTIKVADQGDESDEITVSIKVEENRAPTAPVIAITPNSPNSSDELTASTTSSASDPDGDPITYLWSWTVDGVDAGISSNKVSSDLTEEGQVWAVTTIATDGGGDSPPVTSTVTIGQDGPEVTVSITPTQAYVDDTLSCVAHAGDSYGGEVTVTSEWRIGDDTFGSADERLSDVFVKDDVVTCWVEAKSDRGVTTKDTSVQIQNSPPVINGVSVSPSVAYTGNTLTCVPSTTDADVGDELSHAWEWYVDDGSTITSVGTDETLSPELFVKTDQVWCRAQADDGLELSSWRSSGILIIQNTRPTAPTVDLGGLDIITGAEASCSLVAPGVDADLDPLRYEYSWTVDGAVQSENGNTFTDTADLSGSVLGCSARSIEEGDPTSVSGWSVESTVRIID